MPWSRDVSDGTHVLLARLAHYVDQYSEKHREEVLSLISKDTLRRYRDYERALDGSDSDHKNFGPRRLDFRLICRVSLFFQGRVGLLEEGRELLDVSREFRFRGGQFQFLAPFFFKLAFRLLLFLSQGVGVIPEFGRVVII